MRRPWLGPAMIVAVLAFTVAVFPQLPERIATHWNAAGEPDDWMGRWPGAFLGVGLALAVWLLLRLLPRIDPRRSHYERFWDTYWPVVNLIVAFMALLQFFIIGAALGWPMDIARLVLAAAGLSLIALGNYLPRVRYNWWMGIRTPWTLESERVWRETHRLAGRTFVAGGLITLAAVFLPPQLRPWVVAAAAVIGGFTPAAYSYIVWRRERRERRA